jgi:hypothetical protein
VSCNIIQFWDSPTFQSCLLLVVPCFAYSNLKMDTVYSPKMSGSLRTTQCYNPEECILVTAMTTSNPRKAMFCKWYTPYFSKWMTLHILWLLNKANCFTTINLENNSQSKKSTHQKSHPCYYNQNCLYVAHSQQLHEVSVFFLTEHNQFRTLQVMHWIHSHQ